MSRVERMISSLGLTGVHRHINQADLKTMLEAQRRGRISKKVERSQRQAERLSTVYLSDKERFS